jgi:hypothetical protein
MVKWINLILSEAAAVAFLFMRMGTWEEFGACPGWPLLSKYDIASIAAKAEVPCHFNHLIESSPQ